MASVNVSGRTRKPITIPIPPTSFNINGSVLIGGTEYIARMISCTIDGRNVKEGCHTCQLVLDNSGGFFINRVTGQPILNGGEVIKINFDYGGGTTRLFTGKAEYPQFNFNDNGYVMILNGVSLPEVKDRRIRVKYDGQNSVQAVKDLIDTYLSTVASYTAFNASLGSNTTTITATYNDYIHRIIADIFDRAGWDGYWDFDSTDTGKHDLNGFLIGASINDNVTCSLGQNIITIQGWGKDFSREYNTIKIVGKNTGGSNMIRTVTNTNLRNQFWRRDEEVQDSRITTNAELIEKGDYELNDSTAQFRGVCVIVGNKDLLPGKTVRVLAQHCGIQGLYAVRHYQHQISFQWITSMDLNDHVYRFADGQLERQRKEDALKEFDNPNDMEFSINMDFEGTTDVENTIASKSTNVTYVNGVLVLSSGTSGVVTSTTTTLPSDVTQCDMILKNPVQFTLCTIEASNDGGVSYTTLSNVNTVVNFPASGRKIKIRITLNADNALNQGPTLDGVTVRSK